MKKVLAVVIGLLVCGGAIAQQGKAFRNEITMGQFLHRTLEFDLMESEYFIHPDNREGTY